MAANIQGACTAFKSGLMNATFNLASDTLKAALYYANSDYGYAITVYGTSGEVSGSGYTAGGKTVTAANAPTYSGTTAYWTPSANVSWTSLTISSNFDCWLLYDSTASNGAIAVFTFPAQTIAAGTFTISMPVNAGSTALLQLS